MSNNLDKSLDDIISSQPKRFNKKRASGGVRKAVVKPSTASKKAVTKEKKKATQQKAAAAATAPGTSEGTSMSEYAKMADRIIISHLPSDVTESSVKEYFSHEIGPIKFCQASYNARGQSTGIVSVTFKRPGDAAKAVNRFNGTAIDNGARTMKVELVMDPTKKPLSARLNPAPKVAEAVAAATSKPKKGTAAAQTAKPAAEKKKSAKKSGSKKKGAAKRPAKTAEELDAEMQDYFDNASSNAAPESGNTNGGDLPV